MSSHCNFMTACPTAQLRPALSSVMMCARLKSCHRYIIDIDFSNILRSETVTQTQTHSHWSSHTLHL